MSTQHILYEQPLNEHFRACLRLEHLFRQVHDSLPLFDAPAATRTAVSSILDMVNVLDRPDLKTKLFKELGRQANYFAQLRHKSGIDEQLLDETLQEIDSLATQLHALNGRLGKKLREDDILNCARQHLYNPGGGCQFDAPLYHFWLTRPTDYRQMVVEQWLTEFELIEHAVNLVLSLTRQCGAIENCTAKAGFHQIVLPNDPPCQLIRLFLPPSCMAYPEVSVGKHQVYIRFLVRNELGQWQKSEEDIDLQVACCAI